MNYSTVCRTCLGTENLNPIFLNTVDHKRYTTALRLTTGLKVELNDNLPQNMCASCVKYLNDSLKFRKQSRDTFKKLTKIKITNDEQVPPSTSDTEVKDESVFSGEIKMEFAGYESSDKNDLEDSQFDSQSDFETKDLLFLDDYNKNDDDYSDDSDSDYDLPLTDRSSDKFIKCKLCFQNLLMSDIEEHNEIKHKPEKKRPKASYSSSFSLKKLLKKPKESNNIGNFFIGFKCSFCDSEFNTSDELTNHSATCIYNTKLKRGEGSKKLVECHLCHKQMLKASLKGHIRIKHAGLGPVCEHCGKRVHNTFRLEEHYRAMHGYEKFKCTVCEFQTASSYSMRDHERRHRGEKPYICESCGAKFHAAYLLNQHKKSHRTEKPYKCELCPGSFKTKNSLLMHKTRCHSDLQYKCSLCERVYPCRRYAVKHMRHTHKFEGTIPTLQTLPRKEATGFIEELNTEEKC